MAFIALSRGHRIFQFGPWRHSRGDFLCSVAAANSRVVAVLDTNNTCKEEEVVVAGGEQNLIPKSDAVLSALSREDGRLQPKLRVLRRKEHGLHDDLIPGSTWGVLDKLDRAGYEAYLVGGSVRDLLLNETPKDFDVLSTADPYEVKRTFPGRGFIVGRRFPICHVNSHGTTIEVSSFSTQYRLKRKERRKSRKLSTKDLNSNGTEGWDERDFARWENCTKRDFTVNGLMYDPYKHILYDYVGGLRDLQKAKVRTVIPADESFTEDPARILRAIRIAARLGFSFAKKTGRAIKNQRFSLLKLNKSRIMQEANMFFAYGAGEPSLRLLWRYGILEILLPFQAAYFVRQEFKRQDTKSNLLLDLFRNLDKVVAPNRPCHGSLWVALLAFHLAISSKNSSPVVVAAAALSMFHTNRRKGARNAKRVHSKVGRRSIKDDSAIEDVSLTLESDESVMEQAGVLLEDSKMYLNQMMDSAENGKVMQALVGVDAEDSQATVGISFSQKVYGLFKGATRDEELLEDGVKKIESEKKGAKKDLVDPEAVTRGDSYAVCYLFSRIVLNTLYPRVPVTA